MLKAVIIDDEKWARKIILNFGKWQAYGIEIVGHADDGLQGLKLIEEKMPDIVITDMQMPNMDGVALLQTLEASDKAFKIIVISGYDDFDYMKQAIRSKVFEYILKPVDPVELNNALMRCVQALSHEHDTPVRALYDLISQQNLEQIIDQVKTLRPLLSGTDDQLVTSWIKRLTHELCAMDEEELFIIRLLHDYLLSAIREEMMDVLQHHKPTEELYDSLKRYVEKGSGIVSYMGEVEALIKQGITYRKQLIMNSQKHVVELVKNYVDEAYREDISLSGIAGRFFVSKEYLSHAFKSKYGVTLGKYILKLKMEAAAQLLHIDVPHKEIAKQLGYKEATYFYKVFKKYYGCTPGEYKS